MPDDEKVPDASALGAVAFGERRSESAVRALEGASLCAPALLRYELASIARSKIRAAPSLRDAILSQLAGILELSIHWIEIDPPIVVRLAIETGLTTYDASYLAVALERRAELVTFDRRLRRAWRARTRRK